MLSADPRAYRCKYILCHLCYVRHMRPSDIFKIKKKSTLLLFLYLERYVLYDDAIKSIAFIYPEIKEVIVYVYDFIPIKLRGLQNRT